VLCIISSRFQNTNFSLLQNKVFIGTVLHSISWLNIVIYFLKFIRLLHIYSGLCSHLYFNVRFNVYDQRDCILIFLEFSTIYKTYTPFSDNLILPEKNRRDGCREFGTPNMRSSVKENYQNLIPKYLLI
jgi:hypothetical protein